jgi:hypothetical protein
VPTKKNKNSRLEATGAVEIMGFVSDLDVDVTARPECAVDRARGEAALPRIAAAVGQDPTPLQIAFRQISEGPFSCFLSKVWAAQ